jgi:hypothetical protein
MRSGSTLTVACQVFSSSAPEQCLRVGQSLLDRRELARRVSLNSKQPQPDTAPFPVNGMRAQLTQDQDLPAVRLVGH